MAPKSNLTANKQDSGVPALEIARERMSIRKRKAIK